MGRPPLAVGTYGTIGYIPTTDGWMARAKFRDYDGRTRPVSRTGKTKTAARLNLQLALRDRQVAGAGKGGVTVDVAQRLVRMVGKPTDVNGRFVSMMSPGAARQLAAALLNAAGQAEELHRHQDHGADRGADLTSVPFHTLSVDLQELPETLA